MKKTGRCRTIIEPFLTTEGAVPINWLFCFAESPQLDDLEFWEKKLEAREMDYCITEYRGMYRLYTDVEKWAGHKFGDVRDSHLSGSWRSSRHRKRRFPGAVQFEDGSED